MLRKDCQAAHSELIGLVDMDLGAIGTICDRIQKLARRAPEITALCELSQPQKMRRLLIVKPVAWGELELRWAKAAIGRILELKKIKGYPATLALACFGVGRKDLGQAMTALEKAAQAAPETAVLDEPWPVPPPEAGSKAEKMPVLHSLKDLGVADNDEEELDPETLAELAALKQEVMALGAGK